MVWFDFALSGGLQLCAVGSLLRRSLVDGISSGTAQAGQERQLGGLTTKRCSTRKRSNSNHPVLLNAGFVQFGWIRSGMEVGKNSIQLVILSPLDDMQPGSGKLNLPRAVCC
jgi:hypothetical protein